MATRTNAPAPTTGNDISSNKIISAATIGPIFYRLSTEFTGNLENIISNMTPEMHRDFLIKAAIDHDDVMQSLNDWETLWQTTRSAELLTLGQLPLPILPPPGSKRAPAPEPLAFAHHVDQVFELVEEAMGKDPDTRSEAMDITHELMGEIEEILEEITTAVFEPPSSNSEPVSFEKRHDAIEAIRDIYEIFLVNMAGHGVGRYLSIRGNLWDYGNNYLFPVFELFTGPEELEKLKGFQVRDKYVEHGGLGLQPGNGYGKGFVYDGYVKTISFLEAFVRMNMAAREIVQDGDGDLGTDKVEGILLGDGRGPAPRGRDWER